MEQYKASQKTNISSIVFFFVGIISNKQQYEYDREIYRIIKSFLFYLIEVRYYKPCFVSLNNKQWASS